MRVTYIGHATLLIELGGSRLLTDPNFDTKLGKILPRVTPPGIELEALPSLDAILLTHAHADHLSFDSLDRLPKDVPVYAPPVIADWLNQLGYRHARPLSSDQELKVGAVSIRAAAATHKGNRYGFDRWRADASMYLLSTPDESCFFAGDTALTDETHHLVERTLWNEGRELDLALLPIGYAPWWKKSGFRKGHLTHQDALELFERLRAHVLVPYHWGTFRHVTATAFDAIDRMRASLASHHLADSVRILEPGESISLSPNEVR
ncbi:MAG TPA: MBL fold metallo-hydrolase [Gemmatimonadaceae bacterium]|jgi:L-ascorbate metabolism protein UlaG (beta-lactamase superfamily)